MLSSGVQGPVTMPTSQRTQNYRYVNKSCLLDFAPLKGVNFHPNELKMTSPFRDICSYWSNKGYYVNRFRKCKLFSAFLCLF